MPSPRAEPIIRGDRTYRLPKGVRPPGRTWGAWAPARRMYRMRKPLAYGAIFALLVVASWHVLPAALEAG